MNGHDNDLSIYDVALEIVQWQAAAQRLPLTDVNEAASDWLNSLAEALNGFNATCKAHVDTGQGTDALVDAVLEVARQATAAAIFTLGLNRRVRLGLTAQTN
jgi:hypothetical protein